MPTNMEPYLMKYNNIMHQAEFDLISFLFQKSDVVRFEMDEKGLDLMIKQLKDIESVQYCCMLLKLTSCS